MAGRLPPHPECPPTAISLGRFTYFLCASHCMLLWGLGRHRAYGCLNVRHQCLKLGSLGCLDIFGARPVSRNRTDTRRRYMECVRPLPVALGAGPLDRTRPSTGSSDGLLGWFPKVELETHVSGQPVRLAAMLTPSPRPLLGLFTGGKPGTGGGGSEPLNPRVLSLSGRRD